MTRDEAIRLAIQSNKDNYKSMDSIIDEAEKIYQYTLKDERNELAVNILNDLLHFSQVPGTKVSEITEKILNLLNIL